MANYGHAGEYLTEKDISQQVPSVASTSAAIVGYSAKGDPDKVILVTDQTSFEKEFGQPVVGNWFHYAARAYLSVGNQLYCQRVQSGALYGGVAIAQSGGTNRQFVAGQPEAGFFIDSMYPNTEFYVFGRDPGVWNNGLAVTIAVVSAALYTFSITVWIKNKSGAWTVAEKPWTVSRVPQLDGFGNQMYLETVINGFSNYIRVADNTGVAGTVMPQPAATPLQLTYGSDGNTVTDAMIATAWSVFANKNAYNIRMLINGGRTGLAVHNAMIALSKTRADCEALLDMPSSVLGSAQNMADYRNNTLMADSSFAELFTPWILISDQYSGQMLAVPPSGYAAALIAYANYVSTPWAAAAGFTRANLNIFGEVIGICDANRNRLVFDDGEMDILDGAQINYFQVFAGRGNVLWNEDTLQVTDSALSSAHIRRLLIYLETNLGPSLLAYGWEPNDSATRFRLTAEFEQFCATVSAQGGFQTTTQDPKGYQIVCDETNNTPATIDQQQLIVWLFVKPIRVAKYLPFQVVITPTGVSFSELINQGVVF